jgi:vacuolar-type H+-ATPase catalytic subunit A/Vma1
MMEPSETPTGPLFPPGRGAVVAIGPVGKGKVVLNGMVTGLADGDVQVAPEAGERDLLIAAVRWLAEP